MAIATLTALYLYERNRWLGLFGAAFVLIIVFMSVYSGFHYAVDSYASVIFVIAAHKAVRHFQRR